MKIALRIVLIWLAATAVGTGVVIGLEWMTPGWTHLEHAAIGWVVGIIVVAVWRTLALREVR